VEILDHEDQRMSRRQLPDDVRDRFEDPGTVLQAGRCGRRPIGDLRKQAGQVLTGHGGQPGDDVVTQGGAQRFDPGREGQHVFTLAAAPEEELSAAVLGARGELVKEATLPDAGLTDHEGESWLAPPGVVAEAVQPFELEGSADEGRLRR
jgi:hypothetical protein